MINGPGQAWAQGGPGRAQGGPQKSSGRHSGPSSKMVIFDSKMTQKSIFFRRDKSYTTSLSLTSTFVGYSLRVVLSKTALHISVGRYFVIENHPYRYIHTYMTYYLHDMHTCSVKKRKDSGRRKTEKCTLKFEEINFVNYHRQFWKQLFKPVSMTYAMYAYP